LFRHVAAAGPSLPGRRQEQLALSLRLFFIATWQVRTKSGKQHGFIAVRLTFSRNSAVKMREQLSRGEGW
jgi:hypothetical protein